MQTPHKTSWCRLLHCPPKAGTGPSNHEKYINWHFRFLHYNTLSWWLHDSFLIVLLKIMNATIHSPEWYSSSVLKQSFLCLDKAEVVCMPWRESIWPLLTVRQITLSTDFFIRELLDPWWGSDNPTPDTTRFKKVLTWAIRDWPHKCWQHLQRSGGVRVPTQSFGQLPPKLLHDVQ